MQPQASILPEALLLCPWPSSEPQVAASTRPQCTPDPRTNKQGTTHRKVGIAFIGVSTAGPPMVGLVFCPHGGSRKPGTSTRRLPGLVKHAKLRGWRRGSGGTKVGQEGLALGWAAHPRGRTEGAVSLEETGRKHPGWATGEQSPEEAPATPGLARGWRARELGHGESHQRVYLPPQIWVLGAWGGREDTEGTY